ncbi:glycosyltransferase [Algoriphagus boritolerans]|uniref:Glycosyltransferase involved in cell wall bisynthesis n=1 Tax=Algoriphagus boritolerans DSM 17298 = JCM 18970 TaxID=1120964 RepID=A0A1H5SCB6_9BACT|nr:glycosyltransferase [Algoriphagus boritolerans]SEF48222.1 Glycosyltransferase involved in cell wall bisynthesis [Algoriphagus boritolerans DSM 17298 = JCM 18970]
MNLFFLSSNFVPQHVNWIRKLIVDYNVKIYCIHISKKFQYIPLGIESFYHFKKSELSRIEMFNLILEVKPSLMYVAGYADRDFLWLGKKTRNVLRIPVISGCDTQWRGEFRQWIGLLISKWIIRPSFSHFIVSGVYQYEWVRKLGYKKENILFNMYSADNFLFNCVDISRKELNYPHSFIFVGRFVEEKGIGYLVKAWDSIIDKCGWTLTLIGDGPLKDLYSGRNDIIIKDYMSQDVLIKEIQKSGCFILPSIFEPWAVVIHEFACAGLPIIATEVCGATPHFVINGFNGLSIKSKNVNSLIKAMEFIINRSDSELFVMAKNSRKLSNNITQEISAASLMSVLFKLN